MNFYDSAFAFVTAHFAAGHEGVLERNRDYITITSEMLFKGRPLLSHEYFN
jgi:hypothetical protein